MFDETLKQIKKLERMNVPIQLPLDDDSYLDRKCPSEHCQSEFKVQYEDWRDKVRVMSLTVLYVAARPVEPNGTQKNKLNTSNQLVCVIFTRD